MHVWPIYVHVELQLLAHGFDVFQTFLIVGACPTDPDLDFVFDKSRGEFAKSTDDAFECGCNLTTHVSIGT